MSDSLWMLKGFYRSAAVGRYGTKVWRVINRGRPGAGLSNSRKCAEPTAPSARRMGELPVPYSSHCVMHAGGYSFRSPAFRHGAFSQPILRWFVAGLQCASSASISKWSVQPRARDAILSPGWIWGHAFLCPNSLNEQSSKFFWLQG
jgi:hypothetical protein